MLNRYVYPFGLLMILIILGASYYLQYFEGFEPCPLCLLQRFAFGLMGVLFFLGIFIGQWRFFKRLIPSLALISAVLGAVFSGRQVYLQRFVHGDHESCGMSLQYMLRFFPLNEVFSKVFAGSAECTKKGFEFLYMNMAEWSFLLFVGFCLVSGMLVCCSRK